MILLLRICKTFRVNVPDELQFYSYNFGISFNNTYFPTKSLVIDHSYRTLCRCKYNSLS